MSQYIWDKASQELVPIAGLVNINDSVSSEDSTWSSKKINDSLVDYQKLGNHKVLDSITDLNSLFTCGTYGFSSVQAKALTNCPTELAFELIVENPTHLPNDNSTVMRLQTIKDFNGNIYVRNYVTSKVESKWSAWQELATTDTVLPFTRKTTVTSADDLEDGFVLAKGLTNAPASTTNTVSYKTITYGDNAGYRVQEATINNTARKFIRYKAEGTWNVWKELATMDNVSSCVHCGTLESTSIQIGANGTQSVSLKVPDGWVGANKDKRQQFGRVNSNYCFATYSGYDTSTSSVVYTIRNIHTQVVSNVKLIVDFLWFD